MRKKGKKGEKKAKKASAKDERKKGIGRKKGKTTVVYRYWFFCHIVKHQQLAEDPSQIGIFAAALLEAKQIVGIKRISAEALQFSFATQLGSWVRLATQPLKSPFGNATKGVNMLWPNNPKSSFGNATKRIRNLWPKLKKSVWKRNQKNKHAVTKTEKDQTAATEQSKNWQCIALAGSKQEEASKHMTKRFASILVKMPLTLLFLGKKRYESERKKETFMRSQIKWNYLTKPLLVKIISWKLKINEFS